MTAPNPNRLDTLQEAQATLSAIIESTGDFIWAVDAEGFGLLVFNHGFRDHFLRDSRMTIELGHRPEDLFQTDESVRVWREYYGRALRDGPYSTEYAVFADSRTWNLTFNLMIRNGCVFGISVFGRDITERKVVEESIRKSEQRFWQFTEESPVGIYVIQAGKLAYVNPSLARQAGYSREEMVGKLSPQELIHHDDVARLMTTLRNVEAVGHEHLGGVRRSDS